MAPHEIHRQPSPSTTHLPQWTAKAELELLKSILRCKPATAIGHQVFPLTQTPSRYLAKMELVAGKRVPFTTTLAKQVRRQKAARSFTATSLAPIEEKPSLASKLVKAFRKSFDLSTPPRRRQSVRKLHA
ncbi:Aste57867_14517 [Aphanomyces stellatus]|uniref:Aste57867_14517 protein n=1 Tax=Aphanomyces stellatus TaxID=120398 RepID=A0A485L0X8_9STRA|nr:hypothetical protein As57867_014463 [Aphanomyces stellatus]VFT91339.1 Aste57867_14517 [Aphanomyces stellatus]